MKNVPETFKITDELYWFEPDIDGARVEVLAYAESPSKKKKFPMVWAVHHGNARIAGIALGHDGRAHDLREFKQLLKNAVAWVASRD
jgi:type 1 glutamine amidotransferase